MPGQPPLSLMPPPPQASSAPNESSSIAQDIDILMTPAAGAPPNYSSNPYESQQRGPIVTRTMSISTGGDPDAVNASRKADSVAAKQQRMLGKLDKAFGKTDSALKQQRKDSAIVRKQVSKLTKENEYLRQQMSEFVAKAKTEDLTIKQHLLQLDQGTDRRINKLGDYVDKLSTTVQAQGEQSKADFKRFGTEVSAVITTIHKQLGEMKQLNEARGASKPQSSTKADSELSDPYDGLEERTAAAAAFKPRVDRSEVALVHPGMLSAEREAFHDPSKKVQCRSSGAGARSPWSACSPAS